MTRGNCIIIYVYIYIYPNNSRVLISFVSRRRFFSSPRISVVKLSKKTLRQQLLLLLLLYSRKSKKIHFATKPGRNFIFPTRESSYSCLTPTEFISRNYKPRKYLTSVKFLSPHFPFGLILPPLFSFALLFPSPVLSRIISRNHDNQILQRLS